MRSPGEMTLQIHFDHESQVYRYQFIDDTVGGLDETYSGRLAHSPHASIETLVRQLDELARGQTGLSGAQTRSLLKGKGIDLWQELIPLELQRQFWERRDRIRRLFILSDDNPFPWELLYPFRSDIRDAGFLAEQFTVVRWIYGDPPVSQLQLDRVEFVLPDESPDSAHQEITALQKLLLSSRIPVKVPTRSLDELLGILRDGTFNLLHFACHNTFNPDSPAASHVRMGVLPLQLSFLSEHRGRFREASPLVFMNACRTDGRAPLYTRLTGWAHRFLDAGAGAFLGTQWEVRDDSARMFAEEFYGSLISGSNLGDAVQAARRAIQDEPGDPTWLAYTFYGDPAATLGTFA
jgi:hypothetical protein